MLLAVRSEAAANRSRRSLRRLRALAASATNVSLHTARSISGVECNWGRDAVPPPDDSEWGQPHWTFVAKHHPISDDETWEEALQRSSGRVGNGIYRIGRDEVRRIERGVVRGHGSEIIPRMSWYRVPVESLSPVLCESFGRIVTRLQSTLRNRA